MQGEKNCGLEIEFLRLSWSCSSGRRRKTYLLQFAPLLLLLAQSLRQRSFYSAKQQTPEGFPRVALHDKVVGVPETGNTGDNMKLGT